MWWEPHTERDFLLLNAVTQLRSWFRAQSNETAPISWGVGSGWSYDLEQLVPLVLLNNEIFTREARVSTTPVPITLVRDLGFPGDRSLPEIDTRLPIYCLIVNRPQPSNVTQLLDSYLEIRDLIVCEDTSKLGTAGVAVFDQRLNSYGLLTAGHIFRKAGSRVKVQRWKYRLWQQREDLGQVSHHVVPQSGVAGWDAAVIQPAKVIKPRRSIIRRMLDRFDEPEPVVVHGALSGSVSQAAALQGALVEGGASQMKWKNCWIVAPTGVLTGGDSGAAVFTRRSEAFLGVYVGASTIGADESPLAHYVQDGYSLEQHVFPQWQVTFR